MCASKDKLVVADFDGHPQIEVVDRNRDAVFQWPEVGDGFVVWSDAEGPIILQLQDLSVAYLEHTPYSATVGAQGSTVWWAWVPDTTKPPSLSNGGRKVLTLS